MIWLIGLHNHPSRSLPPPCPTSHLGQLGKNALPGSEIRQTEPGIRPQHAHKRYMWKMQTLGNHLGAHQDINLLLLHGLQQIKQMPSTPAAVAVHSGYACGWKKCSNLLFNALSAKPAACYLGGTARRTNRVWTLMKATVVAEELIAAAGKSVPVVVKLERQSAVDNLAEILHETDVVMVARGDLGVECPLPLLPALQKRIISACNKVSKPVIVATQMLLSMVNSPAPTRAETTDVANAVLDGADCVMLSEETAMGNFPVETVRYMRRITDEAERLLLLNRKLEEPDSDKGIPEFLAYSACLLADKASAKAIVSHSLTGSSARQVSARRPPQSIYALTPDPVSIKALNFVWGVKPIFVENPHEEASHLIRAESFIHNSPDFEPDDCAVITAGQVKGSSSTPRGTNLVKIYWK